MDYTELLHNFIDDGLTPHEEENLFSELADNSTLRTEFKNFLEFEKAVKSDLAAFVPPVESTAGIFSTLGISTSTAIGTSALIHGGFWAKYGSLFLTNALAILVTGVISYFIFTDYFGSNNFAQGNSGNKNIIEKVIPQPSQQIPIVSNLAELKEKDEKIAGLQKKLRNLNNQLQNIQNNFSEQKIHDTENNLYKQEPERKSKDVSFNSSQEFTEILNKNTGYSEMLVTDNFSSFGNFNQFNPSLKQSIGYNFPIKLGLFELNDFSVMMSGSEYKSYPNPTVSESSSPFLKDGNLVLLYDLNRNLSLGLDIRQEFFFQSFTGLTDDKSKYLYEQNTNFTSFGLIAKYAFMDTKYFVPFGQLYLGGNKVGLIGRALLGFELKPSKEYGFILGIEGSGLRYSHNKNIFYSKKLGAYYGVIFHF